MKNYCRKVLSLLVALCMSVSLLGVTAFAFEVDFSRYQQVIGDYYMVNFSVIGIPQNPVPDNFNDCTIGGTIDRPDDIIGGGSMSAPHYDLGTEVGTHHFQTGAQAGTVHLTITPDPGVKIDGIAKVINGSVPFLYGNISIDEIPTNVYSGSAVTNPLPTMNDDGTYDIYFNIPSTADLNTTEPSYFAVKYAAVPANEIPAVPTNLKWTKDEANSSWVLSWDSVADAEKYQCKLLYYFSYHDYTLKNEVTGTNKWVLSDNDTGLNPSYTGPIPCNFKVKVSSIKNKVRSVAATAPVHSFGEWIIDTEATETTPGAKHRVCAACGNRENAVINPTNPNNPPVTPPVNPTYPSNTTPIAPTVIDKLVVKALADENTVTLNWNEIKNADEYIVYCKNNGEYEEVLRTKDTSALCIDLKNGKTYDFLVKYSKNGEVVSENCWGKASALVYYKPVVKATSTNNSVKLKWRIVPDAEKYAVYKYVNGKAVKLCETEKLAAKIVNLKPDTEYKYIVRAYVDGEWTTMKRSDVVTVKTAAN